MSSCCKCKILFQGSDVNVKILTFIATMLFAGSMHAAPVSYNETIDGEVGSYTSPGDFILDVGVNKIAGTGSSDVFNFHILSGMELQAVYYGYEIHGSGLVEYNTNLYNYATSSYLQYQNVPISTHNLVELFALHTPLSSGDYKSNNGTASRNNSYSITYEFIFNVGMVGDPLLPVPTASSWSPPITPPPVQPVPLPLPSAIWLLGMGLSGLFFTGLKRRSGG